MKYKIKPFLTRNKFKSLHVVYICIEAGVVLRTGLPILHRQSRFFAELACFKKNGLTKKSTFLSHLVQNQSLTIPHVWGQIIVLVWRTKHVKLT